MKNLSTPLEVCPYIAGQKRTMLFFFGGRLTYLDKYLKFNMFNHRKLLTGSTPLFITLFLILIPLITAAANPLDVVVNEIAWMGTQVSYNDEWIELYNNTDSLINLDGWFIVHFTQKGEQGSAFDLSGTIPARGFYLLERTDDNSVPNITADKIYTGPLNNNGELLQLSDEQGTIIDLIDCIDGGWLAGDDKTKQTMERISPDSLGLEPDNWQTSQNPGGTPKSQNSIIVQIEPQPQDEPPESIVEVKPQQPTQQPKIYPTDVVFNEILPSPEGADEKGEWIEIFNQNNFEVDLSDWQISDTVGKITTLTFPAGTKITPNGFLVLSRPDTKITLNNDGDGLNLIQPDGKIIDSVTYEKAPRGQSYNRINSDWTWSTVLTPGKANIIPKSAVEGKETKVLEEKIGENAPKEEVKEKIKPEQGLAAIGKQVPREPLNSFFTLLIGLAIALFSGVIILILKKQIKKVYNQTI